MQDNNLSGQAEKSRLQVRPLKQDDIPRAMELVAAAGWNQTPTDWKRMVNASPQSCFQATLDELLVGTITSLAYGQQLAWIGMMLIAPEYQRQGIGRLLMQHMIEHLRDKNVQSIMLDATPAGEGLYRKLGFQVCSHLRRWRRDKSPAASQIFGDTAADRTELDQDQLTLDKLAFGVDRSFWLSQLAADSWCTQRDKGFGMRRSGRLCDYIGPVISQDHATAESLIIELESTTREIFWDIPAENVHAENLARKLGFSPVR